MKSEGEAVERGRNKKEDQGFVGGAGGFGGCGVERWGGRGVGHLIGDST